MEYSSHEFVTLNVHMKFRALLRRFYEAIGMASRQEDTTTKADSSPKVASKIRISPKDYFFRPRSMDSFPLYFFMAGDRFFMTVHSNLTVFLDRPTSAAAVQ